MSSSADKDHSTRERPSRATLAWALPYPLLGLALVIWLTLGLVEGDAVTVAGCSIAAATVIGACALVTLSRDRVRGSYLADAGLLVAASVAAAFALEVSWCRGNLAVEPKFLALEAGFALLALLAFYLVFQRRGIGAGIGVGIFCAMGLAQYFVRVHKGTAILPSDVLGMATAMSVAGGYVYKIDGTVILGISIAAVGWCLCSLMHGREAASEKGRAPRRRKLAVAGNLGVATACTSTDGTPPAATSATEPSRASSPQRRTSRFLAPPATHPRRPSQTNGSWRATMRRAPIQTHAPPRRPSSRRRVRASCA